MKKGKYAKKKKTGGFRWLLILLVLIAVAVAALWIAAMGREGAELPPPETTQPQIQQTTESESVPETTAPAASLGPAEAFQPINLGYGVCLEQVRSYTGTYMEDGSDQLISGVMMILVRNDGEDDIQLMHIEVAYADAVFHFKVTNLPAGSSAVLLELDRSAKPQGIPTGAVASNVVLFSEPMEVDTSIYEISGADGMLNVKNISGADIGGDIYVYYKYKAQDVYYGGITFRVEIQGGLKAGEIRQVMTSHFNPDNCEVIMIEAVQRNGN